MDSITNYRIWIWCALWFLYKWQQVVELYFQYCYIQYCVVDLCVLGVGFTSNPPLWPLDKLLLTLSIRRSTFEEAMFSECETVIMKHLAKLFWKVGKLWQTLVYDRSLFSCFFGELLLSSSLEEYTQKRFRSIFPPQSSQWDGMLQTCIARAAGSGVGECPFLGALNITSKYLLEFISPIVGWCETLGHLPTGGHANELKGSLELMLLCLDEILHHETDGCFTVETKKRTGVGIDVHFWGICFTSPPNICWNFYPQ